MDIKIYLETIFGTDNPDLLGPLAEQGELVYLKKGMMIAKQGEAQKRLFFLVDGIFRCYFIDDNGNEITDCFVTELGTPALAAPSLEGDVIAIDYIETCSDALFFAIPVELLQKMVRTDMRAAQIYIRLLADFLERHYNLRKMSYIYTPEERYRIFQKKYGEAEAKLRQKDIASYLGMTAVSLSRIRKRISQTEE